MLRSVLLAVLSLLSVLALVGCGAAAQDPEVATANGAGDSQDTPAGDTDSDTDPAADAPDEEQMRQFAACMREHGVDMPDPEPGGGPVRIGSDMADAGAMDDAMKACRSLMPNGGERPEMSQEDLEKARAMAACMREHGVDVPDPDPDGGGITIRGGEGGDSGARPDESAMRAALEACRHLGPGDGVKTHTEGGPGGGSGGSSGDSTGGGG